MFSDGILKRNPRKEIFGQNAVFRSSGNGDWDRAIFEKAIIGRFKHTLEKLKHALEISPKTQLCGKLVGIDLVGF